MKNVVTCNEVDISIQTPLTKHSYSWLTTPPSGFAPGAAWHPHDALHHGLSCNLQLYGVGVGYTTGHPLESTLLDDFCQEQRG